MATTPTAASPSFTGSLRDLGEGVIAGIEHRLELLAIEVQEEKFRLVQVLLWIGAVFFTGLLAAGFASFTLIFVFWESARLVVLSGLAGFYIAAFVAVTMAFRRFLARQPAPFAVSLHELKEDRGCIRPES